MPSTHYPTVVIGKPIPVPRLQHPSHEEVARHLGLFIAAMVQLFEKHKAECGCGGMQLRVMWQGLQPWRRAGRLWGAADGARILGAAMFYRMHSRPKYLLHVWTCCAYSTSDTTLWPFTSSLQPSIYSIPFIRLWVCGWLEFLLPQSLNWWWVATWMALWGFMIRSSNTMGERKGRIQWMQVTINVRSTGSPATVTHGSCCFCPQITPCSCLDSPFRGGVRRGVNPHNPKQSPKITFFTSVRRYYTTGRWRPPTEERCKINEKK